MRELTPRRGGFLGPICGQLDDLAAGASPSVCRNGGKIGARRGYFRRGRAATFDVTKCRR
jgi:hypothetical protein